MDRTDFGILIMPQTTSKVPQESDLLRSSAPLIRPSSKMDSPSSQCNQVFKRPPVAPQKSYNQRSQSNGNLPNPTTSPATKRPMYGRSNLLSVPRRSLTKPALLDNYHNTLNPNYRPLENSSMAKPKPLEASLFVSRSDSKSGGSGDSCVSLTISRSPSPYSNRSAISSSHNSTQSTRANNTPQNKTQCAPYRVFPQSASGQTSQDIDRVMKQLEPSSVVFDANMSFFLGTTKQNVRQNMRPSPAHQEPETASNYLSDRISSFLMRTDHVMEEWKGLKKASCADKVGLVERDRERQPCVGRSRSAANIMVKGYQILQSNQLPPTSRSRPSSVSRSASVMSETDTLIDEEEEEVEGEVNAE